jgi:hypothetical protein
MSSGCGYGTVGIVGTNRAGTGRSYLAWQLQYIHLLMYIPEVYRQSIANNTPGERFAASFYKRLKIYWPDRPLNVDLSPYF